MRYEYITRPGDLARVAEAVLQAPVVGVDIETLGLDPRRGRMRLLQVVVPSELNEGRGSIFVIDLFATGGPGPVLQAFRDTKAIFVIHNCLTGCSRVLLADGSSMLLRDMVRERHPGPVVTVNERTGAVESKRVTGWIKREPRSWDDWVRVRCQGKGELRATVDHKVLTERGWVRAGRLIPGDRILSPYPALSRVQESVLYGTLLGDGSINCQKKAKARVPYVSFAHCVAQRDYARWKYELLGDLKGSWFEDKGPRFSGVAAESGTTQVRARTRSDPRLLEVWETVSDTEGKRISPAWLSKLGSAEVAVWLADDGSLGEGYGIRACVSAFNGRGSDALVGWLQGRGWPAKQWWRQDGQEYVTISGVSGKGPSSDIDRFWIEVSPYFPTSMVRKVPERYRERVGRGWENQTGDESSRWADKVLEVLPLGCTEGVEGGWARKGTGPAQYCLEVEDNHNFVANGRVVSNSKFEQKWFWWKHRFRFWPVFCTFRASALLHNGRLGIRHDLDSVVTRELNEVPEHVGQGSSDWSGTLTQAQKDYAAEDVLRLLRLRDALKSQLEQYGLLAVALVEFGVVFAESRVELNGFALHRGKWVVLAARNSEQRTRLREELLHTLPHPRDQLALPGMGGNWNLDSPQQVLLALRKLGLKVDGTSEIVLAQHAGKYPLVRDLLHYRHVAQRVKTFGNTFLRHLDEDGRIRPEYFGLLVTGRYSANKSMQQIPREREFRACFEAPEGRRLVGADYCLVPETRVLRSDLKWVEVGELKEGEELIGFDEELDGRETRLRASVVEKVGRIRRPCLRITTNRGTVVASDEHGWVCEKRSSRVSRIREWVKTRELEAGDEIAFLCDPWEEDTTRPTRLLIDSRSLWEGRSTWGRRSRPARVLRVEPVHDREGGRTREVVAVRTSTKTLIAEGFLTHNSGIEMRLCAEISGDEALTQVFSRGEDIHKATASVMLGIPLEEVTKADRQHAKPVNFGFIYGMMPDKFVLYAMANYGVAVTPAQAKRYRERYFERYAGVERWHHRVLRDGQRNGFSRTLCGRIRYLDPTEAHNEFFNSPIQGSGADALKVSLAIVQDQVDAVFGVSPEETLDGPVRIVHHVHDEIILEVDDDLGMVTEAKALLHDAMKAGMEKFVRVVPVVVDPSDGRAWSDIH